jgi:uroporphyrin-III C-methyltransferase/precorrin-2 dehydrogenase/sirohydrochlorin ferrochelatase
VVADGTRPTQTALRSTLGAVADDIAAAGVRPPAVVVVGPVAALGTGSETGPPAGPDPR